MAERLQVGMLVEWQGRPHVGYGVVTEANERTITVQWDSAEEGTTPFASRENSLLRVDLSHGQVIRYSTEELVIVHGERKETGHLAWDVTVISESSGTPRRINIQEADLRPQTATAPELRIQSGQVGSTDKYLLRQVTSHYLNKHLHDDLVSLGQSQVDIKPHQVSVVHRVTQDYPHRYLLCDETGLGKTIEAGMIIKELRAWGGAQRVLVICPANLVMQWQEEMASKFNEEFAVLNGHTVQYLRNSKEYKDNPFANPDYAESFVPAVGLQGPSGENSALKRIGIS